MEQGKRVRDTLGSFMAKAKEAAQTNMPTGMSPLQMQIWFAEQLKVILYPRTQSDRTTFARISSWLLRRVQNNEATIEIFGKALKFAREATGPKCRNPAAVFISILKRELGYKADE